MKISEYPENVPDSGKYRKHEINLANISVPFERNIFFLNIMRPTSSRLEVNLFVHRWEKARVPIDIPTNLINFVFCI